MSDPRAFLQIRRRVAPYRPVEQRLADHGHVAAAVDPALAREQAGRCTDCGVPFCQHGCPLHNVIPDWNELAGHGRWDDALDRLHATNNFPEFTGKLCPAPCEEACVLALSDQAVTIKQIEMAIIERGFDEGAVRPRPAAAASGRRVAVIGSGPAGLAAAQQLTRAGHRVTVFERARLAGGLLRYGIPDFKLEKEMIDRRLEQMLAEGTRLQTGTDAGRDIGADRLLAEHDAIVLATGAQRHRELDLPGRTLVGVEPALPYLVGRNRDVAGERAASISARGRRVIILGGGDTSADCLGNALREGALSVHEIAHGPIPPRRRDPLRTWPEWPALLRTYAAHEEGGERRWELEPIGFDGSDGRVTGVRMVPMAFTGPGGAPRPAGDPVTLEADLVLLAVGFDGVERDPLYEALGVRPTTRGTIAADPAPSVFAAGDCVRGADLIVTAIAEGRAVAERVHRHLAALPAASAA